MRSKESSVNSFEIETGWEHAVVSEFAVCCAGGVLGIRAGVILCDEENYIISLRKICRSSLKYVSAPPFDVEKLAKRFSEALTDPRQVAVKDKIGVQL